MRWALSMCVVLAGTAPAWACGGLFCARGGGGPPAPVDQSGEVILFEVDEAEGTVCATVQIQYQGDADTFAWIVPVPSLPELDEGDSQILAQLAQSTAPQVRLPPSLPCDFAGDSIGEGGGCGAACVGGDDDGGSGDYFDADEGAGGYDEPDPVEVFVRTETANYEAVVLGAEQASDLVGWLQENDFNVSDNMIPSMQPYADEGMKWVGVKLREGRTAQDIQPLRMCYAASAPAIPIRLTAVAATPHLGILVFIVANSVYGPANFQVATVDNAALQARASGFVTNYFDWVARVADAADGHLFVAECAGPRNGRFLSRFYTRLSPHQMDTDPVFVPSAGGAGQLTIDLSGHPPLTECGVAIPENQPSPCAFNFCGRGATCVSDGASAGCLCTSGQAAQTVSAPGGVPRVTCTPAENPLGVTGEAVGAGTAMDPCARYDCFEGSCLLRGGVPVCVCDEGAMAVVDASGLVRCAAVPEDAEPFGPGAGVESASMALYEPPAPRRSSTSRAVGAPVVDERRSRISIQSCWNC